MAGRLVTIATFGELTEAHTAKNALEAAGIQVALDNEQTSSLLGQVLPTIGIRLVVREEDEPQAVKILDETFGTQEPVDETDLAAQAAAAPAEDTNEAAELPAVVPNDPNADSIAREKDARAALFAACLGWVTLGIGHLFALVMIMNAASGPGKLSPRGWRHVYAAGLIAFAPLTLLFVMVILLLLLGRL